MKKVFILLALLQFVIHGIYAQPASSLSSYSPLTVNGALNLKSFQTFPTTGLSSISLFNRRDTAFIRMSGTWRKLTPTYLTGSNLSGQIAVFNTPWSFTSYPAFMYTGTARAPGAFYSGTVDPISTTRLNYDGSLYSYQNVIGTTLDKTDIAPLYFTMYANGSPRVLFQPSIPDGPVAVAFKLGTRYTFSTIGSRLLEITNGGVVKFYIDYNGNAFANGIQLGAGSGSGGVTSVAASGGTTGLAFSGSPITSSGTLTLSGTLLAASGGTGQNTYTIGDMLFAGSTSTLSRLSGVATGNALISGGVGTAPSWGKIGLGTHVSGTLPAGSGGTGQSTYTIGDILFASGTSTLSRLSDVALGNMLLSGGTGVAPIWGKADLTSHVTNILPVANGGTGSANGSIQGTGKVTISSGGDAQDIELVAGREIVLNADSVTMPIEANGEFQWLMLTPWGRVFGDYMADEDVANFGLTMPLPSLSELLTNTRNGEIAYYLSENNIVYGLGGLRPSQRFLALWSADEMNKRYIAELQDIIQQQNEKIEELEIRITHIEKFIVKHLPEFK